MKAILGTSALLLLAGCGGGDNTAHDAASLQGLWYEREVVLQQTYVNPLIVVQTGQDILVTTCDRSTTALRLIPGSNGGKLVQGDGQEYTWQPAGEGTMTIPHRAAAYALLRRFSPAPRFDSGRLALGGTALTTLQANQDVCAGISGQPQQTGNGEQTIVRTVLISAPYMGSHVQLRLGFQALAAGEFTVRDRTGFLRNPAGSTWVELQSPAFTGVAGQGSLAISAGQVLVKAGANGIHTFEGALITASGAQVTFSAEVVLERRP
ncbi:hypothetical protein [Massilia niabensis]|uniref:Lipocalin-like domain-containing protein n=1 Tax=Massilia niabensis TaxID=544910 RepID=A0ABW0L7I6_9BURK